MILLIPADVDSVVSGVVCPQRLLFLQFTFSELLALPEQDAILEYGQLTLST